MSASGRRLIAASTVSTAVIVAAPLMGQIRGMLRSAFPAYFGAEVTRGLPVRRV